MSGQLKSGNPPESVKNRGWIVTFAGTGINLALGVLYAWSVVSKQITKEWGWNETEAALAYSVAIAAFAFRMVPAGRLPHKFGPRLVATRGGIFCGRIYDAHQKFNCAYLIAAVCLLIAAGLTFVTRAPKAQAEEKVLSKAA